MVNPVSFSSVVCHTGCPLLENCQIWHCLLYLPESQAVFDYRPQHAVAK